MRCSHLEFLETEILFVHSVGRRESTYRNSLSSHPQVAIDGKKGWVYLGATSILGTPR